MEYKFIKNLAVFSVFILSVHLLQAQFAEPNPRYALLHPEKKEVKNYYFLSLLEYLPDVHKIVMNDPALSKLSKEKYQQLATTTGDIHLFLDAIKFSNEEIESIGNQLMTIYEQSSSFKKLFNNHILASGCYIQLVDNSHTSNLLKNIWVQDAKSINRIIDIYGKGEKPIYSSIDSISFQKGSRKYNNIMALVRSFLIDNCKDSVAFYSIPFRAGILLLDINDRDEAVVYEPLLEKENKAAYQKIRRTDWKKYPYSSIAVLGSGPDNYDQKLNPVAKIRLQNAALKYREGAAPFIMLSG